MTPFLSNLRTSARSLTQSPRVALRYTPQQFRSSLYHARFQRRLPSLSGLGVFDLGLKAYTTKQATPPSSSFPDPDRPDLFYHLFEPPTPLSPSAPVFALSFLPQYPTAIESDAVIGWLPASAPGATDDAGLNDFVENDKFRATLHEAVQSALRDGADDVQLNAAVQTQQGWMHVHDSRNIPALGRIGDPDDIIASVRVEDGKILAETYQPMPSYRLCTSDGVTQLTEGLAQRLREILETRETKGQ